MSDYTIIGNPKAGQGHGAKVLEYVAKEFSVRGIPHTVLTTERPVHAIELARRADSGIVVAVGGDGTINEVANGLLGGNKTMGVIPAGSGNDFIKSVRIPKKPALALEVLLQGRARTIDAGNVTTSRPGVSGSGSARSFVNGVGIGFDAAVAARTREIKYLTGVPLYLLAVFQTLGKFKAPEFRMMIDGEERVSKNLLIAIGNGRCAGGGFFLTPDAVVDDGLLDVCLIDSVNTATIVRLLPLVLIAKHRNAQQVKFLQCKTLAFESKDEFFVHADGEIVGRNVSAVSIEIRPGALKVIGGW